MLQINNYDSAPPSISQQDRTETFSMALHWFSPMKIIVSKEKTDSTDYSNFANELVKKSFYFKEKSLKEILPILSLEFKGVGTLMHFLVWNKHFSPYKEMSSHIKFIEEKCEQELTAKEREHYLFIKNSEGVTYKELDQKFQDEKIKNISFNSFQQNLQNITDAQDRNDEIPCDPQVMIDVCKNKQFDLKALRYRANRTDDGDSPLFFEGDTLLNIAEGLYLRGQLFSNFLIFRLYIQAYANRIFGGNRFLRSSNIEKFTGSAKKRLLELVKRAKYKFALNLLNALCQQTGLVGRVVFTNLPLLLETQIENQNFFHFYIRKFWQEGLTVKPEAFENVFKLFRNLKELANSKWNPFSKICQSILEEKNSDGETLETLHCKLARETASLQTKHFLSVFFSCPEIIDDELLFDFRIDWTVPSIYGMPTYLGDTLLHIAFRLYLAKKIDMDFLEKIINKAITANSERGRAFLEAKNARNHFFGDVRQFQSVAFVPLKDSLLKLVRGLHSSAKLSAWESMLITSFTEEAREQLAKLEDKEMVIAKLMKQAEETRKQKILYESNSLVEEKFIRKLKNSIKKLF